MIRDIRQGKMMIVTDLHGDGFDYRQILKVYEGHKEKGLVDFLVFIGDLIHSYPGKKDESTNIVQDLINKGANNPDSDIICLLGNHEFVHIYHIPLIKGHLEFTTWFERRISRNRQPFIDFFQKMPFALRTSGGVLVHHTGAAEIYDADSLFNLSYLQKFSHFDILKRLADTYPELNPFGEYNHKIGQTAIDTPEVSRLWDMLMNGNERQYGDIYHSMVADFFAIYEFRQTG